MRISAYTRLSRSQKSAAVGIAAVAGVAALGAGAAPHGGAGHGGGVRASGSQVAGAAVKPAGKAAEGRGAGEANVAMVKTAVRSAPVPGGHDSSAGAVHVQHAQAKKRAVAAAKAKQARQEARQARGRAGASRSAARPSYPNNLDGWIKQARAVMKKEGIPGSYHGIKKNVMRESGGDPNVANNWDVNAQKGTPSKGLLQVIQPTFDQYHVKGTKDRITDPVANIVAACNYAADKYGSMDNVNSAY